MGKWNKTACFLLSAATSAICLLPVLSGCSLFVPPKEEDPPVTGVEATVEDGKTTVRWEAQEGAVRSEKIFRRHATWKNIA